MALIRFNRLATNRTDLDSHVNNRYLSTNEKQEKLRKQHSEIRSLNKRLSYMKEKIARITKRDGVCCASSTSDDICTIMKNEHECIMKLYPEGSFQRLFWEQQYHASKLAKAKNMKWHPLMIKWCIYLRYKSSGAYEMLRESGCIKLPSQRTLRDYTHVFKSVSGFSVDVDVQLMKDVKMESLPTWKKCVLLIIDEISVREDLVYDKHSDELIGFTDIGNINNHLLAFERSIDESVPVLADSMLIFMVRGLFLKLQFPYAMFPCKDLVGDLLFTPIWEAVFRLEKCGFQVFICTLTHTSTYVYTFSLYSGDGCNL